MMRLPTDEGGFVDLPAHLVPDGARQLVVHAAPGDHDFELHGHALDASRGVYSCGGFFVHAPGASDPERTFYVSVLRPRATRARRARA